MRFRWLLGTVGVGMGLFGMLRFLQHDLGDIVNAALWLVGGVVVHDAVIAPLTLGATLVGTRLLPRRAWVVTATGLIVLLTVTATAIPVLGSWGARPDNPTLLDRNYVAGWCVFAVLVLLASLVRLTPAWRRLVHRSAHEGGA